MDINKLTPNTDSYRESVKENSENPKNEKPVSKKVIEGKASVVQPTGIKKFAKMFFVDDLTSIKEYVMEDVLIPNLKRFVVDSIDNAANMFCYGDKAQPRRDRETGHRNYSRIYDDQPYSSPRPARPTKRPEYYPVVVDSRREAEDIVQAMQDTIDRYGIVKVSDVYDFAGYDYDFTSCNYGWSSIEGAKVKLENNGYAIYMPKPVQFD